MCTKACEVYINVLLRKRYALVVASFKQFHSKIIVK